MPRIPRVGMQSSLQDFIGCNRLDGTISAGRIRPTADSDRIVASSPSPLKVARSLVDLEQADGIRREHRAEGLQYRPTMLQPVSPLGKINQRRLPHLSLPPILNLANLLQGSIHRRLIRQQAIADAELLVFLGPNCRY